MKYVNSYDDRHGKLRHYFRSDAVRVALPGKPGSPSFTTAYGAALKAHLQAQSSTPKQPKKVVAPSGLSAALRLGDFSRREIDFARSRLQLRTAADENTGCTNWTGCTSSRQSQYGRIVLGGRSLMVHRLAYVIYCGDIASDLYVCHSCDNPQCVNPAHLFLGTRLDNAHDAIKKDRFQRGETNGNSKLTEANVREIRRSRADADVLAQKFRVSGQTIEDVRHQKTWRLSALNPDSTSQV